jgi:GH43 family beta-xylosidase
MAKRKFTTGDNYLLDETLELEDEFDLEEFENDPMFDPNDHEYLQELNNEKAKDGQPLPLDRYFNRFRKNRQSN